MQQSYNKEMIVVCPFVFNGSIECFGCIFDVKLKTKTLLLDIIIFRVVSRVRRTVENKKTSKH